MLLFKRLLTAAVLFVALFIVLFILSTAVLGGIAGVQASGATHATDFQSGYAAGREAGAAMGQKYGGIILLGSTLVSAVTSLMLSFSNVFPWCRRTIVDPSLQQF